jgi:hypothetical protein
MRALSLALYCEGNSDKSFLPGIIEKTTDHIILTYATQYRVVSSVEIIKVAKQKHGQDILEAAKKAYGRDVLIVHKDADRCTYDERKEQSFDPGKVSVLNETKDVCKNLIPIIPVREVEAWMIADPQILLELLEIKERIQNLTLPKKAVLVESVSDPKAILNTVIRKAEHEQRRKFGSDDIKDLFQQLGEEIRLERLMQVPAYKYFARDLAEMLAVLGVIPRPYDF